MLNCFRNLCAAILLSVFTLSALQTKTYTFAISLIWIYTACHFCFWASVAPTDARPTGDQDVAGLTPTRSAYILWWRLIMKHFLQSFLSADSKRAVVSFLVKNAHIIIIIIGFLINVQVQGQHPHQWAPFQIAGLLHAWQISHQSSRYVYHEGW